MEKAFYAFPSKPEGLSETIKEAIKMLNKKRLIKITPWTDLSVSGKIIIHKILNKITESDLFVYELSQLNVNVCFEVGYAIAKGKKLWATLDGTEPGNEELLKKSNIFSSIGYSKHQSDEDIVKSFCKEKPYEEKKSFISQFNETLKNNNLEEGYIFYLKSPIPTTPSKKLTKFLQTIKRKIIEFDIKENSYQVLDDLLIKIKKSKVLIVHLQNQKQDDHREINAFYSLAAGIAIGFGIKTLILAPHPYESPMDYRNIMFPHKTAKECIDFVRKWIFPILSERSSDTSVKEVEKKLDSEESLIRFYLGDEQAENEVDKLGNFFVETSPYHQGLNDKVRLFIGRKGVGKTANLFKIKSEFEKNTINFITMIKPQSFRLGKYIEFIDRFFPDINSQSQIIEKIWEFIIYGHILLELYEFLKRKPESYDYSQDQLKLIDYSENQDILTYDLGEKIDFIYVETEKLTQAGGESGEIIGYLHKNYLQEWKSMVSKNLPDFNRIVILIDNLDKAWNLETNTKIQCNIIFGLLGYHKILIKELNREKWDVRFHVFLREDIYREVLRYAREPDKLLLISTKMIWNDRMLLLRVIEERLIYCDKNLSKDDIWSKLFCPSVRGLSTKIYLYENINRRPRDLLFFVKPAINVGINHKHKIIEEEDILSAQQEYFDFLISNTETEYKLFFKDIRELLYSFDSVKECFDYRVPKRKVIQYTTQEWPEERIIEFLIRISFLGVYKDETKRVEFAFSDREVERLTGYYKDFKKRIFGKVLFGIHPSFYFGLK